MTTALDDVPTSGNIVPAKMSNEELGEYVASESVGVLKRMDVLRPYFEELWSRFDALQGETIQGCTTKTEFCEKILHRSRRSVNYILHGRPAPKSPVPAGTPTTVPLPDSKPPEWLIWCIDHPCDEQHREKYGLDVFNIPVMRRHMEYYAQFIDNPREVLSLSEPHVEGEKPRGENQATALKTRRTLDVPTQWLTLDNKTMMTTNALWQNVAALNKLINSCEVRWEAEQLNFLETTDTWKEHQQRAIPTVPLQPAQNLNETFLIR
jgi:hypothetical protein